MNENQIREHATKIGVKCFIKNTGSAEWKNGHLTNSKGLRIGRVIIQGGEYSHVKWYFSNFWLDQKHVKKSIIDRHIDDLFYYMFAWEYLIQTGEILTKTDFAIVVEDAIKFQKNDLERRLQWRRDNPKKGKGKRKALHGLGLASCINRILKKKGMAFPCHT